MRRASRVAAALAGLLVAGAIIGCASLAPTLSPPSPSVSGLPPSGASAAEAAPAHAALDTVPSPEARRVLAGIPEPLAAGEISAPPLAEVAGSVAAGGARDSTAAESSRAAVPIPTPTTPLGDQPGSLERMLSPDSAVAVPADSAAGRTMTAPVTNRATTQPGTSGATTPAVGKAAATPPVASQDCFRLQVGAPSDPHRAEQLKQAAESQLELAFEVKKSSGLYKVRSHDCLNREAIDHLRARALAAGFQGVFAVPRVAP